jgi:mRNA-degrading endonuclease RelE of RelBE toxin-antitoxin system
MEFRIADTFQQSLERLTGENQRAAKTAAFDLQTNPATPGLQVHRIDRTKDKNFWSARVNRDIRLIFHRIESSLLLCYVDHHDDAYEWAYRRRLETHPVTGAAQLVEIRETVREIEIPHYVPKPVQAEPSAPSAAPLDAEPLRPLTGFQPAELLSYGVPEEWLADLLVATEDQILELVEHLPAEAAEAMLELATGSKPAKPQVVPPDQGDPFQHPDAQRRFRTLVNAEELARALDYPWERWIVFLHPAQRDWVEREFNGPTKVQGSAGTGKTVVALHRVVHLARTEPDSRLLLTTFSEPLAALLQDKLNRLIADQPSLAERIDVLSMSQFGERIHAAQIGKPNLIPDPDLDQLLIDHAPGEISSRYGERFTIEEFREIVDAFHLRDWEAYRDVRRLGRKSRLAEPKRWLLWQSFEAVLQELERRGQITRHQLFHRAAERLLLNAASPYQHIVVDECQDITAGQLRLIAAIGGTRRNGLFFAGDLGQRIFQQPFSWTHYGVDIRGRSRTLKINYRTSHQIREHADQLLDPEGRDLDGNVQDRRGAVSVFNGPEPLIVQSDDPDAEIERVAAWLKEIISKGLIPREIGVFVRSDAELPRAQAALELAEIPFERLTSSSVRLGTKASLSTMHLAKGLEFRAVVVMACDEDVIPSPSRIEAITDDSDLDEVYATERHLLYVACTRARDHLLISSGGIGSEFLEDME